MTHVWERVWEDGTSAPERAILHCARCGVECAVVGPVSNVRIVPIIGHRAYEDPEYAMCDATRELRVVHSVMDG